ncbi:MAG: hypothetical protein RLZZ58_2093 [Pseudomonadota bacterium]
MAMLMTGAAASGSVAAPVALQSAPEFVTLIPMPQGMEVVHFQIVIEERLIIRVPARRSSLTSFSASEQSKPRAPEPLLVWKKTGGPKCLPMRQIMGVLTAERDSIDIVTREQQRFRAELNRGCRALDFYSGFYMQPTKDGQLCRDRDDIHARSGAKCQVDKFSLMVPTRRKD